MRTLTKLASSSFPLVLLALGLLGQPALAQIAPGVTQSAAHAANISGTVTQSNGTPVGGADVRLTGPSILTTKSDDRGVFSFTSVPWGDYQLSVTSSLGIATRAIAVNGDLNVAIQYQPPSGLRTIAHVSTSSAGVSINVTPANIASISPSDYAFRGNTSWQQLLNQIPGVTVGGGLRNGISCGVAVPGNPFQPTVLSINGAAPYETSVTLDGMPMQNVAPQNDLFYPSGGGSGADISFLPLATFDTADIVRGPGANAPSIVDSIGGAFVLHAPGAVTANHFEYSVGTDQYGGIVSNAQAALKFGRLSVTLNYGLNNSPGPLGDHAMIPFNEGWPLLLNGQSTVGGGFGGIGYVINNTTFKYLISTVYCCEQYSTAWTQHNGSISLLYNVTPTLTAQVFFAGSSSQSNEPDAMWQYDFATYGTGYTAPQYTNGEYNLINPTEEGPVNKGESMLEEKVTDYIGNGVLRIAALQNNSYYQIGFPYLIPPGNYKVYGTVEFNSAPTTPVNYNGSTENLQFYPCGPATDDYWTNNRDLLANYTVQVGSQSNLEVGYVTSYYNAPYWERFWTGGVGGLPYFQYQYGRPASVASTTNEFHATVGTQVSDKLSLTGSWYFTTGNYHVPNPADYAQYAQPHQQPSSWVDASYPYNAPRLSAVWRANSNVAIRAAAGGGFALPPILDLVGSNSVTLPCTTVCSETKTNLNLRPEESFGWDVGTDVRFHYDTMMSFDFYRTDLYGQFFEASTPGGTFGGFPVIVNQYQNLAHSRFQGINLDVRHDPGARGVYWNAALGLTRAYVVSVPPGFYNGAYPYSSIPCTNCVNTQIVPGVNFNGAGAYTSSVSPVPYANGTVTLGYRWKPGTFVDLQPTYYGNNNPYLEPAFVELDGHVGYALTRNVTLYLTARNITGEYDESIQTLLVSGVIPGIAGANPIATQYPFTFPTTFYGIPFGPRSLTATVNFKM